MNINNLITIYDINRSCPPNKIVVSHDSDVNTRTVEVIFRQGVIPLAISTDCTAKAAFVERNSNILINDNVPCTVTDSGHVLIPVDNLHRQGRFDMNIELAVTNQGGEKVLVTPFPMWITVNASILNDAEVTEESKGTVPELLEEAAEALARNKDYNALENRPQINGHVLTGNQTAEDLGITGSSEIASGTVNDDGTITFYDKDGNPLFTTTGAGVIGPQGNSVTSAEILNNHLILYIGVLQPDGTILNTPIDVGRVVGQNGARGQHGDGYTTARIDENGDLIMTEVVYTSQGSTPMVRQVNLGRVVGADGISVTGAEINNQGHLILTLSDGTTIDAGYIGTPKTDIAGAAITLSQNAYTYDGTSKAPTVVSVTLNGQALTAGTDYAVVANPATNAGQYVVTVNGIGDYTGTATTEWTITKAQATITGDDSITVSGLDEPVSKTYTTNGDGTLSFSISGNIASVSNVGGTVTITPSAYGSATLTVTVSDGQNYFGATKIAEVTIEELQTATVFGAVWDYSLSSPQLARLTPQTDPLGVVTTVPTQEPIACVGNDGNGQSDFDNYLPWKGMNRYNYVNGQVVDFVDYSNGETFVYIPVFWSKIVNDSANSKMYFYISDLELAGFTQHPGSGRYMSRYECNENFLSASGFMPKVNTSLTAFRTGITAIDSKHFQYDFSTYNAIEILYIVEFADLNSQAKIGAGITSGSVAQTTGQTDTLTYHTGRVSGTDNVSAIQYRWIENLWGNIWKWVDGILIQDGLVYICEDPSKFSSTITNDYRNTGLTTPSGGWLKAESDYANSYLIPLSTGGSDSTFLCDNFHYGSGLQSLAVGGASDNGTAAGLFSWYTLNNSGAAYDSLGGRSILILGGVS